ncbi:MAG: YceI family protein [Cyclobacteriaceae bacterium]
METLTKTTWVIDPTHSEVGFKVKHLVISTVTGTFKRFEGILETETEDFTDANCSFKLDVSSIDTNVADRDARLRSDDFFSAEHFPSINFSNGKLIQNGDSYQLVGNLTVKGISKEVALDVDLGGVMVDPHGQTKAGFEINGKINSREFGLTWNAVTAAGGVVFGDEVKLHLHVQVVRQ